MKQIRKFLAAVLVMVLVFSLSGCAQIKIYPSGSKAESSQAESAAESSVQESVPEVQPDAPVAEKNEDFARFEEELFIDGIKDSYVYMHQFLEDPEEYGIDRADVKPELFDGQPFDQSYFEKDREMLNELNEKLSAFDREELSPQQQNLYDELKYELEVSIQLSDARFDYYQQLFGTMDGIQYQLPVLFADWHVRSEAEVQELIALLENVRPYVNAALDYARTQQEMGLLMVDFYGLLDHCYSVMEPWMDSSVLAAMEEDIEELGLDEEKTADYEAQLEAVFEDSFLMAYSDMAEAFEEMKEGDNNELGYCFFPEGKDYFELLVQQNVGSTRSVEEVRTLVTDALAAVSQELVNLVYANDAAYAVMDGTNPTTQYTSYEEILEAVRSAMKEDFPEVSDIDYDIQPIDESIAEEGVVAYFVIPPVDANETCQIRVNESSAGESTDSLSVFHALAHEGLPGHMYQFRYMAEHVDSDYQLVFADNLGYQEGWAVYAQYEAARYLPNAGDLDMAAALTAAEDLDLYTYFSVILLDIGIHYDGLNFAQFQEKMVEYGFGMEEGDAWDMYVQLQANPAAFESYYVGFWEFITLKNMAIDALGDNYSDLEFHETVLKNGTIPFDALTVKVQEYIDSKQ